MIDMPNQLQLWNIPRLFCFASDSEPANATAFSSLSEERSRRLFCSIHLISGQWQAGVDDFLATEQERVRLESDIAIVGILCIDRRFDRPTVFTFLAHQKDAGDRRDVPLLWLGDLPILDGIRIPQ